MLFVYLSASAGGRGADYIYLIKYILCVYRNVFKANR